MQGFAKAKVAGWLRAMRRDRRGVSILEFALALPIFLILGLYGTEVAYMSMINMEVSEIATSVADNSSRIGQTDNSSVTPTVTETQVASVMTGGLYQGNSFNFEAHGRIILSSLEINSKSQQYIHWQRCSGDLTVASAYGVAGTIETNGMGRTGHMVMAPTGMAVMYVEVYYDYQPLFGTMFVKSSRFEREAALLVRDDRNLTPGVTGGNSTTSC
ncbi:TadE/TadG family type IV pilus assembly protein [Novosphingobium sp. 9]|uniref:TadE/TadG family type IV pilus assembly protein n=1 Tax=Novosphingobium sp. 9 TaxID=2025349 RepID=UPI0021B63068|nr:pilus assembly protein TadE [Novosphingobium sp. 9]